MRVLLLLLLCVGRLIMAAKPPANNRRVGKNNIFIILFAAAPNCFPCWVWAEAESAQTQLLSCCGSGKNRAEKWKWRNKRWLNYTTSTHNSCLPGFISLSLVCARADQHCQLVPNRERIREREREREMRAQKNNFVTFKVNQWFSTLLILGSRRFMSWFAARNLNWERVFSKRIANRGSSIEHWG